MVAKVGIKDEPPAETRGKGTPIIGRTPNTAPILMNA
jgi:hypothetical protein